MLKTLCCQVLLFQFFLFTLWPERIHFYFDFTLQLPHLISTDRKPTSVGSRASLQHCTVSLSTPVHPPQLFMWQIHDSPYSLDIYIATCDNFCSIYPPSGRLSHLVNPKGETCRCTTAPLNPFPALFQPPPSNPAQPVVGAVQTAPEPSATPAGWSTKAAFTSTFWWPSEGNVVVAGR